MTAWDLIFVCLKDARLLGNGQIYRTDLQLGVQITGKVTKVYWGHLWCHYQPYLMENICSRSSTPTGKQATLSGEKRKNESRFCITCFSLCVGWDTPPSPPPSLFLAVCQRSGAADWIRLFVSWCSAITARKSTLRSKQSQSVRCANETLFVIYICQSNMLSSITHDVTTHWKGFGHDTLKQDRCFKCVFTKVDKRRCMREMCVICVCINEAVFLTLDAAL